MKDLLSGEANARHLTPNGVAAEPSAWKLPGETMSEEAAHASLPSSSSSSSTLGAGSARARRASLQVQLSLPSASAPRPDRLWRARMHSFDGPRPPSPPGAAPSSEALRRLHDLTQEMQLSLEQCKSRLSRRRGSTPLATSPVVALPPGYGEPHDGHAATLRPGWETRRSPEGREATNSWRSSGSDDRDAVMKALPPQPLSRPAGYHTFSGRGAAAAYISVPNLHADETSPTGPPGPALNQHLKMTPRVGLSSLGAKRQEQLRRRRQRNLTTSVMGGDRQRAFGDVRDGSVAGERPDGATPGAGCGPVLSSAMRNSVSFCGIDVGDGQSTMNSNFMANTCSTTGRLSRSNVNSESLVDVLHRRYYSHQYIANARSRPYIQTVNMDKTNGYLQPTSRHSCEPSEPATDRSKGIPFPKSKSMNDASLRQGFSSDVVEAIRWLIEAGFPQYGQMFEDGEFPLDLETIREDHRFMDDDALSALFRRINTLNEFVHSQRKDDSQMAGGGEILINKMGRAAAGLDADADADAEFALSRRWQFERDTRRWSRVEEVPSNGRRQSPGPGPADSPTSGRRRERTPQGDSGSRSLLRSASLRLRTAVSRFRRGDLNFRSLRRQKKASPSSSPSVSGAGTDDTAALPSSASAAPLGPPRAAASRVLMSPASRVGPQTADGAVRRHDGAAGHASAPIPVPAPPTADAGGNGSCPQAGVGMQILVNDTIDTGSGDKINIRTGSFMGKAGHRYEAFLRRRNEPPPPPAAVAAKHESTPAGVGVRASIERSNGCREEGAPASELDRILQALYSDIDMLDEMMDSSGRGPRVTASTMSAPTSPRLLDVPSSGDSCPSPADVMAQFTEIDAYDLDAQIVELKRLERLRRGDGHRASLDRGTSSSRGHSSERENSLDSSTAFRSATSTLRRNAPSRWSSVERTCRQSVYQQDQSIGGMSVKQLILLRKIALLKLTTIMEKHCPPHKSLFSWAIPKLLRRGRSHSETDNTGKVFGVSLSTCLQRTGMFLPQAILNALSYLRSEGKTAHGIFRRPGGKARTLALRDQIDKAPAWNDFSNWQAYDVADVVKLFFRELPECLLTNKLSSTLINIFIYLPLDLRLEALQWSVLRLPDENRMVLQCLLHFLRDMSEHADVTQMPASNLAMCLAPTLFNFPHALPSGLSPKRLRRVTGSPDPKDLADQKAAHECLTVMIQFSHQLFLISENILNQCQFDSDELGEPPPLNVLAPPRTDSLGRDWQSWAGERLSALLRECREKGRGWVHVQPGQAGPVEVHHKKVNDGHPLKLWRCSVDVEAPPEALLHRLWHERSRWDPSVPSEEVLEVLSDDAEVLHRSMASLSPPNPGRECTLLRVRQCGLEGGACALLSSSTSHEGVPSNHHPTNFPAFIMQEDVLVDPCGAGKSRVHWLSRVDIRGFTAEWYGSSWGNFMAHVVHLLQKSFVKSIDSRETSL